MPWLIVILGYLLGSIPTGYIAGRVLAGGDIRRLGDENMGAANVYRELGPKAGVIVGFADAAKGTAAVLIAQASGMPQATVLLAGAAAVVGHNWPVFIGFRGGRGVSTTIGVMLGVLTLPTLILAGPALLVLVLKKNVSAACAFLFVPLFLVSWALGASGLLVAYSIVMPCLNGLTHLLRVWPKAVTQSGG